MALAKLNYPIHDKELLIIVKLFKEWRAEFAGTPYKIRVYSDYKAFEYFISNKELNIY